MYNCSAKVLACGGQMSEASDRMLNLLQELALLKEGEHAKTHGNVAARRKRRKEIGEEIKQIATEKKEKTE
jgi:hypothetical protein